MKPLSHLKRIELRFARVKHTRRRGIYKFGEYDSECCISFFQTEFARFEYGDRRANKILVEHFSVNEPFRGARIGETCLRTFAQRIASLDKTISLIHFDLFRLPTNFPHLIVAAARYDLLQRIGAANTIMKPLPDGHYQVTGTWNKSEW